jgi:ATP-dependent DNA helicase RecQ
MSECTALDRMDLDPAILEAIRRVWGYESLRPLQAAAIEAGVDARDCLTVLPTGGGKSLCYQVPPLVTGKATVVISPLIALMRDQVRGLELNGYPAGALHSGVDFEDAKDIERRLLEGRLLLVLAAPERAVSPSFGSLIARLHDAGRLGAIAIDEAHCISQWGHDFRPEYRQLASLRRIAPGVGMQAFTATATPRVREDIVRQLNLHEPEILVGSFDRPNLTYRVRARANVAEQCAEAIRAMQSRGEGGGAIVYCLSRADTEKLAESLRNDAVDAHAYHAGLPPKRRHQVEQAFTNESLDVVVATVAFGMGIDRSNVRLVIHASMPKSVEAYQQETGRAGRDALPAECLLLYSPSDAGRWRRLIERSGDEAGAEPEATEAQLALVDEIRRLVASMKCRHAALSEHFGQTYEADSCDACDVCLGETQAEPDSTRLCQILMSAVARTGQRFGAGHIADVVRGADTESVRAREHDSLSVFALLKGRTRRDLMALLDQLVAANALAIGEHRTLRFGPLGREVMTAEITIPLAVPMSRAAAGRERARVREARPLSPDERDLFERLRSLRKSIADEKEVPPYVVFSDATLRELACARPATMDQMLEIKGIGRRKLQMFGEAFLQEVAASRT